MLYDPNVLYLGTDASNDIAHVRFVDGEVTPHDDPDNIVPMLFPETWRLGPTAGGDFGFWFEGDDRILTIREDRLSIHEDLSVSGNLEDLAIGSTTTRIVADAFENGIHSIRRSAGDTDQILLIEHHGVADYDLHLFQDGSAARVLTDGDDSVDAATLGGLDASEYATEEHVEDELVDIENDGVTVEESVRSIDFGDDLGVTSTGNDSVEVEYVGATIPADVYQDGTLEVEDANGLDFLDDFTVSVGVNNVAEIEVDTTVTDDDETVTGDWNFVGGFTRNGDDVATEAWATGQFAPDTHGNANHTAEYGDIEANETVTGNWTIDDRLLWGGNWRTRYSDGLTALVHEHSGIVRARYNDDGTVRFPGGIDGDHDVDGQLSEQNDRVATRPWVNGQNFATDGDAQPPENHGDEAHTENYAKETDLFSGSYGDLSNVPSTFTPETHGNERHSENFADLGANETVGGNWEFDAPVQMNQATILFHGTSDPAGSGTNGAVWIREDLA